MSATPEPLSEERLAEISARYWTALPDKEGAVNAMACIDSAHDVPALLGEVRRLRKCQQEDWCPGVPVACQKHVDQQATLLHDAKNLLLERARQAEELIRQRDEALGKLAHLTSGFEASLHACQSHADRRAVGWLKRYADARCATVEAAKRLGRAKFLMNQDWASIGLPEARKRADAELVEAGQQFDDAVAALEKLEANR